MTLYAIGLFLAAACAVAGSIALAMDRPDLAAIHFVLVVVNVGLARINWQDSR